MAELADPALLAALMLIVAIVGGYAGSLLRVPRVVGYLVGGMTLHYGLLYAQTGGLTGHLSVDFEQAVHHLHGIQTIALGLIMFAIGNVFEAKHIHAVAPRLLRLTVIKLVCVTGFVGVGCFLLAWLGQGYAFGEAVVIGVLLGVAGVATAPAATLLVLREYEAKGPNADAILTLTAINNTLCIIFFHVAFILLSWSGLLESSFGTNRWLWLDLIITAFGSIALGVVLGFALSVVYSKTTIADFMLLFLGALVVLGVFRDSLAEHWHLSYSFLLTSLFVGATFTNITPDTEPFHNALRNFSGPIFALFFVLAGYELHLSELADVGWIGVGYIVLRTIGKAWGGYWGVRSLDGGDYSPLLGLGMLCQAGVAIGLAAFVATTWGAVADGRFVPHPAAAAFQTVILGGVVVFELFGPVALKQIAMRTGEIKAVTLLRRRRTPGTTRESTLHQAWEALQRTFGPGGRKTPRSDEVLQARHIMRSNVKLLPANTRFDDVLHFVESSRHNHFPVVGENGAYIGMIHYGDLRHMLYSPEIRNLVTAHDLARTETPTVYRDTPLHEMFEKFHDTELGSIAVIEIGDSRRVVGVVEQRDLLLAARNEQSREER